MTAIAAQAGLHSLTFFSQLRSPVLTQAAQTIYSSLSLVDDNALITTPEGWVAVRTLVAFPNRIIQKETAWLLAGLSANQSTFLTLLDR